MKPFLYYYWMKWFLESVCKFIWNTSWSKLLQCYSLLLNSFFTWFLSPNMFELTIIVLLIHTRDKFWWDWSSFKVRHSKKNWRSFYLEVQLWYRSGWQWKSNNFKVLEDICTSDIGEKEDMLRFSRQNTACKIEDKKIIQNLFIPGW